MSLLSSARHRPKVGILCGVLLAGLGPSATLVGQQKLYVGNDQPAGGVRQYTLPINASSTPALTIAADSVMSIAVDRSGNLTVGQLGGPLKIFTPPLSGSSTPATTFSESGTPYQIGFTPAGDMLVATGGNHVDKFTHPFSNSSSASQVITSSALTGAYGVALDAAQNLYVANSGLTSDMLVFAPPYTGAPIATPGAVGSAYRKLAVGGTQVFVCSVLPGVGRVDVYSLPITATSTPAFTITNGINLPEAVALDAAGNLYVGNLASAAVTVYSPPFSASSAPTTSLVMSPSPFSIFGIAISGSCVPNETTLCLFGNRFQVTSQYETYGSSTFVSATATPFSDNTGFFTTVTPGNVDVVVKMVNFCSLNNSWSAYIGGTTDLGVRINITDTLTGSTYNATNSLGNVWTLIRQVAFSCP